jgi:hypothetical protein
VNEIRIGTGAQKVLLAALLAVVGLGIATQLPEIQRYLKIRSM